MARSLFGDLSRAFAAQQPADDAMTEGHARRRQRLVDSEILPDTFGPLVRERGGLPNLHVVVVGGGLAGLTAAWYLRQCDPRVDVTVLEELDRVGGRVLTDRAFLPGRAIEVGAELIGDNHTMWLSLRDTFGLETVDLTDLEDYHDKQGLRPRLILDDQDLSWEQMKQLWEELDVHFDAIGVDARDIDPEAPWTSPRAAEFDGMSVADKLNELPGMEDLHRKAIEFTLANDACAPLDQQSYLGLLTLISAGRMDDSTEGMRGYWTHSETKRCSQGNQALADRLRISLNGDRAGTVLTGVAVTRIEIAQMSTATPVTVTTTGGAFGCDYVILAVPAPQWHREPPNQIVIDPPWPPGSYEMTHGPAIKFLTGFDTDFWRQQDLAPSVKWDQLGSLWESTDKQDQGTGFGLTVFAGGTYILPPGGDYLGAVRGLFNPAPQPTRSKLVDWTETGYSIPRQHEVANVGRRLNSPYRDRLFFAGEQASLGFYGYMEGALRSGARAANRIVRAVLTLPQPSTTGVYLPLGHRDLPADAQRAHAEALAGALVVDDAAFGGDRVSQAYTFPEPAAAGSEMRAITAIWPGAAVFENSMVTVQMSADLYLKLETLLGAEQPSRDTLVPMFATFGPVLASAPEGEVSGGQTLGTLVGDTFTISFRDQNGYYLRPLSVLDRLERLGVWADTGGARLPLLRPAAAAGVAEAMEVAGPTPVGPGLPYLTLRGGSADYVVHNPTADQPPADHAVYFSFIATDTITVELSNRPAGVPVGVEVTDETLPMYRSRPVVTLSYDLPDGSGVNVVPANDLRPHHESYAKANGKREPGVRLTYRVVAFAPGIAAVSTIVTQDIRDVVRQEYVFHATVAGGAAALTVPDRSLIERARRPYFAQNFTAKEFADNNYFDPNQPLEGDNGYLMRTVENFQVAEFLRRRYGAHVEARREANPASVPETIISHQLAVNSNWRNPERNEVVDGVADSRHQYGRALDMEPVQAKGSSARGVLIECLFAAAGDFLEQLIALNGPDALGRVEILVEIGGRAIWKFEVSPTGVVTSVKGGAYQQAWGVPEQLEFAAPEASHVHVSWKPENDDEPLTLPEPAPPPTAARPPLFARNLILIGTEDDSVPPGKRLPLDLIADSTKKYLQTVDPDTPTDVVEVSSPLEWLRACGAFAEPGYEIRYFFSFSHAWPGGLALENFPDGTNYDTVIHDAAVYEQMSEMYDPRSSGVAGLPVGEDDLTSVKTNQLRIFNLVALPDEAKDRMRRAFAKAEGVFVVGCRNAQERGVKHPPFCAALADVIRQPVWGAAYYSKVFAPDLDVNPQLDLDGDWVAMDLVRGDPAPAAQPLVLVPGERGYWQAAKFRYRFEYLPTLGEFPETSDLFKVYQELLSRCDPSPE